MAGHGLPTTSYAVLGLLSRGPMSGYELAGFAGESIAHFWPIRKSQIYGELGRLEELGFVDGTSVHQEKLPDKRVYRISSAGKKAMSDWLGSPDYESTRFRSGFLVKVFFADQMPLETLERMLSDAREKAETYRAELQATADHLSEEPQEAFTRSTALFGVRINQAIVEWAEEVGPALTKERKKKR